MFHLQNAEVHDGFGWLSCAKKNLFVIICDMTFFIEKDYHHGHTVGIIQKSVLTKYHNKLFHQSSACVSLHHCGLCSLRKTVDCDGNVCVSEHLFQYRRHSLPLQSIQATTNTVRKREKNILLDCNRASRSVVKFRLNSLSKLIFLSWTWFDEASLNVTKWKGYKPRHWYSCNSVQYAVWLHVLQALSQVVIGRFLAGLFLCDLQYNTRKSNNNNFISTAFWNLHYREQFWLNFTSLPDSRQNVCVFSVQHTVPSAFLFGDKKISRSKLDAMVCKPLKPYWPIGE